MPSEQEIIDRMESRVPLPDATLEHRGIDTIAYLQARIRELRDENTRLLRLVSEAETLHAVVEDNWGVYETSASNRIYIALQQFDIALLKLKGVDERFDALIAALAELDKGG